MREVPGQGIEGVWGDRRVRLGRRSWVNEIAAPDRAPCANAGRCKGLMCARGPAATCFALEGEPVLGFALSDATRPDAAAAVSALQTQGLRTSILSGDEQATVRAVAQAVGIEDRKGRCLPADKVATLEAMHAAGDLTLMVGDGINDGPALTAATVSMAPSSGSDVGRQAADLLFTQESLAAVPRAIAMARDVDRIVRQNFALAFGYNCLAVPLAMAGYVTPLVAALAMSGSSIIVVANSMRLHLTELGDAQDYTGETELLTSQPGVQPPASRPLSAPPQAGQQPHVPAPHAASAAHDAPTRSPGHAFCGLPKRIRALRIIGQSPLPGENRT